MANQLSLKSLAAQIYQDACRVEDFLDQHGLPRASFDPNEKPFMPPPPAEIEAANAYERLVESTRQLRLLALGPVGILRDVGCEDSLALQFIYQFNIDKHVPTGVNAAISFEELSSVAKAPLIELRRIIRQAMTNRVFQEPRKGFVAHSAASFALRENKMVRDIVGINVEERFSAASRTVDAIQQYPDSQEPTLTGWGLANKADLPLFAQLSQKYPARAERFAGAMKFMASSIPPSTLTDHYDWEGLGDAKVVDIGGGEGPVAIALAEKFPRLKLIVQDFEGPVRAGQEALPHALKDRVSFQTHDFFAPQPVHDADVYFLRAIFHDWPDKYCVRILSALVPALKQGARIVINDPYMPDSSSMTPGVERFMRKQDLHMLTYFNSRDREAEEYETLFQQADPRYRFLGLREPTVNVAGLPKTAIMAFIEAEWTG